MDLLTAIVLGLVQGLTEFLPISSSAHVSIAGRFLGVDDPGAAFTAISQLGTEAAVLIYFRRDIARIVQRWTASLLGRVPRNDPDALLGWWVILGTTHHISGVEMAQAALDLASEEDVRAAAQRMVDAQAGEIALMTQMLAERDAEPREDVSAWLGDGSGSGSGHDGATDDGGHGEDH